MKIKVSDLRKALSEVIIHENLYRQGKARIISESTEGFGQEATNNLDPKSIVALEDMIQSASPEAWALWKNMAGSKMMLRDKHKNAVRGIIKKRAQEGTLSELFHEYGILMDQMEFENRGFFKKLGNQGPAFIAGSALYAAMVVALGMKNPKMFMNLIPAAYSLIMANNAAAKIDANEKKVQRATKEGDYKKAWADDPEYEITDPELADLEGEDKEVFIRFVAAKFGNDQDPSKLNTSQKAAIASMAEQELSGETRKNLLQTREDQLTSMDTSAGQQQLDKVAAQVDDDAPKSDDADFDEAGNLTPAALQKLQDMESAASRGFQDATSDAVEEAEDDIILDIIDLADEEVAIAREGKINEVVLTMGAGWVAWAVIEATYARFGSAIARSLSSIPSLKGLAAAFGAGSLSGLVMALLKTVWDKLGKDEFKMNLVEWLNAKGFKAESAQVDDSLKEASSDETNPKIDDHYDDNIQKETYLNRAPKYTGTKEDTMNITEAQLRSIVKNALIEEGMEDFMGAVGKHGSKVLTRPAGIIAKALGRMATAGSSKGYEKRIDANVEGLEALVAKVLSRAGRGMDVGYDKLEKAAYKIMPDLHPDEMDILHQEIEAEKAKHGGGMGLAKKRFGDAASQVKDATSQLKTAFAENASRNATFNDILHKALKDINEDFDLDLSDLEVDSWGADDPDGWEAPDSEVGNLAGPQLSAADLDSDGHLTQFEVEDYTTRLETQDSDGDGFVDTDPRDMEISVEEMDPEWAKIAGLAVAGGAAAAAGFAAAKLNDKSKL